MRRRQRRRFAVGTTIAVLVVAVGAFALGGAATSDGDGDATAVVIPRSSETADIYVPGDLTQAGVEIAAAYRDVFGPRSDGEDRGHAVGSDLLPLLHRSTEIAQRFGYTEDQIARNVITVSDPSFIDATHAIVRFSITIPDHGTPVRDRVGYAVQTDGRWQVAARTVCDIVWPGTTSSACPARAPT